MMNLCTVLLASMSLTLSDTSVLYTSPDLEEIVVYSKLDEKAVLLAKLLQSEAGNQPDIGIYAVGTVVMNRMLYRGMSLHEVLFEKRQFCGVRTKNFLKEPSPRIYNIAYKILYENVRVLSPWVMYFANPKIAKNKSWIKRIEKHKEIRIYDHDFYSDPTAKAFYSGLYASAVRRD